MKWKILYFDDQKENIECMGELLTEKFNVIGCSDVMAYQQYLQNHQPHALLLDVHMPVMDGYELYTKITELPEYNGCPVMFISGDHSDENKLQSHNCGGIDFFTRDMNPEELMVRILSRVRLHIQSSLRLSIGNLRMDFEVLKVFIGNTSIDLTLIEMRILGILFRTHPSLISKSELIKKVWGDDVVKSINVDVHFSTMRSKLRDWDHQIKSKNDLIMIESLF